MGMSLGAIGELLDEWWKGFAVYDRRWCEAESSKGLSQYTTTKSELPTERERESNLYFAVVTGTRYGTKTPPDQQPTIPSAGDMTRRVVSW